MSFELTEGRAECPAGFRAGAFAAGIKVEGRLDLGLVAASPAASAAALFTKNLVKAAPVVLSAQNLSRTEGRVGAVLFNSGCANAATGAVGMDAAFATTQAAAESLNLPPQETLAASTGVIGVPLPTEKILRAVPALARKLSPSGLPDLAQSILTTDTRPKAASARLQVDGKTITISGIAKGAGMIHPDMATMLVLLLTDAVAKPAFLRRALRAAAEESFHRISVDGDTSTNDSAFLLASGGSGLAPEAEPFTGALTAVCRSLALQIVRDGEGAKKLLTVTVTGGADDTEAERVALAVSSSLLVRTAVAGGDPNWGRILAAVGRAGVAIEPSLVTISVGSVPLFERGAPTASKLEEARKAFRENDVTIRVGLSRGSGSATRWTCDLTGGYIRINADYTT